ncbi:MAG: L,D-transpeptidase family protein [Lachnospiraceae bacterium]|nr:L,D-transpeptidase family protein [Lachnospiraceae bacterium]
MRKKILGFVFLILLLLLGSYFALAVYYREGFSAGTWINQVYCTGKSIEEVNSELLAGNPYMEIILYNGEETETFSLQEIDLEMDYTTGLTSLMRLQNPFLWITNLWNHVDVGGSGERAFHAEISWDDFLFSKELAKLSLVTEGNLDTDEHEVSIQKTADGYRLKDTMLHCLDQKALQTAIEQAVAAQESQLDISPYYYDMPYTDAQQKIMALWQKVDAFQNRDLIYDMGDTDVKIGGAVCADFILLDENGDFSLDENGNLQIDEEAVSDFIEQLADEFDTFDGKREFTTSEGNHITVEGGNYGCLIDRKTEKEYLINAIKDGVEEKHIPVYKRVEKVRGKNDIGDTYIEINLSKQHMYYYEAGKLLEDTPIVTGNMARRRDTPAGVYYVYYKQRNRTLKGPGYSSFVKYWMAVYRGIGIHDASWRDEFGGDIYKTEGSHGCINTPTDVMIRLYDQVEKGTPVVMFYE